MEVKDYVLAAGTLVTLVLGVWNFFQGHRAARKASFINTVTSQRVKWLEQLRLDISQYCGLAYTWCTSPRNGTQEEREVLKEIDRLRYLFPYDSTRWSLLTAK